MHQTNKGNQWYLGINAHSVVHAESGWVFTLFALSKL